MNKEEFIAMFSSLSQEQQEVLIEAYKELLNAHNPQKRRLEKSA